MKENCAFKRSGSLVSRPRNIILVGLSGAGKTSIASQLAWNMGMGFLDLDRTIEDTKKKR